MNDGETIFKNKKLGKALVAFVSVLSLLFFVKLINQIWPSTANNELMNTITVVGEGEVTAVPDIAVLDISISKEAATASEATEALNESIKNTLVYLKEQGIADTDIKSEYGGMHPKYESERVYCITYPCPSPKTKIVAYTATQNINIKIRMADSANEVRSGLADLGIVNITGPAFSIDDEDALKEEARSMAINDANIKAKKLSKDLGVRLGRVVGFYEDGGDMYPMAYATKSMSAYGGDMDIAREEAPVLPKGENKISSKVNVTYRIK